MGATLTRQLIESHLEDGDPVPGESIAVRFDQTLTQDATGTLVMLAFEGMGLDRVRTDLSVQYVDHNLLQENHRNPDDHLFLKTACERFGLWWSGPGNGVSHPLHMQRFGRPGATLIGADSHTPAAGSLGMFALGAGGADVALAMAGHPVWLTMPEVWGVELVGALPPWTSAKDVVLEMLRRHGVSGAKNCVLEYHGEGLAALDAMDRHVIANMGTELGATSSVFPADAAVRAFLEREHRGLDFTPGAAEPGCRYDRTERIDLGELEPLIARPSSPGNVVPVAEVAGEPIYQAYLGSSANPGWRDFAVPAAMVRGRQVDPAVSFDVNPTSRQLLRALARDGSLEALLAAGARLHQTGCNGCIGMGQAPASGQNSLRTVPRNFPDRSGTADDRVWLCSPETATASALAGAITDPRTMDMEPPVPGAPPDVGIDRALLVEPKPADEARRIRIRKGPGIADVPDFEPLPDEIELPIALVVGDDVSTDAILPAGARILPLRSDLPAIARHVFEHLDPEYVERADETLDSGGHAILAGSNYGQGSSREHAAVAPRTLGLRVVVARDFARIHHRNLVNYGILPLEIDALPEAGIGDRLSLAGIHAALDEGTAVTGRLGDRALELGHSLGARQREVLRAGGLVPWIRAER